MTIKSRVQRLESASTASNDVTLGELVLYSLRNQPDPAFEERFAKSSLCALIMRSIYPAGRFLADGART